MTTTLPIPKLYWDTFQSALNSKVKRLVKEIATTLGESEQPLLKALAAEKVAAYLFEEEGSELIDLQSMRCNHCISTQENDAVLRPCRQPVVLGKTACLQHGLVAAPPPPPSLPVLHSLRDMDGNTYWLDGASVKRKEDLECIGFYMHSQEKLRIFKLEE
jgi:hypothetical protein